MGAAAGDLAHDDRAPERLHDVGELLAAREVASLVSA